MYEDSFNNSVPAGVAANPNTPLSIIQKLASHHDGFVRQTVVQNKNTLSDLSLLISMHQ